MRSLFLYNLTLRSGSFLIGVLFLYLRFVCLIMDAGNFCSRSRVSFKVLVLLPMKTLFAFFSPELDKGHEKGSSAADEADIVPLFSPVLEKIFDDDDAKRKPKGFDMSKLLESVIESEKWQSENLVAASPATVDNKVAKGATVAKSGSFKETKVQSTPLDQGHAKQSRPVMESKKKSENINLRRKVDKKVVLAQGDAKGIRSHFVWPTLTPKDGKSIESEKRQEQEKRSRHLVMQCKKNSEGIESRGKQEKAVVVANRKIQRVVPVVRSSPTLICNDVKPIESEKHHQDRLNSLEAIRAVPHQELPNKVAGAVDLSNAHSVTKPKKDVQSLPTTAPATRSHKLSGPARIRRVYVQMPPFHHSRLYVQCGGLKPQMQSQGTTPRLYNHHVLACTHEKSENLVAASPATVDHEGSKGAKVAKSGSFKETKGHEKQSRPVMECKKKSENINSRRKVDKKVVLAQGDAKGVRSPFVLPTLTPKDGKSIKSEKRQEQEKRSRHLVMECKKKSEGIESRGKREKAVVVANRKIQRVVPVRSSPTLICNDVKPIELEKHHQDRLDSLKAIKAVPNQELPNKVAGVVDLSNAHSVTKPKKDVQSLPTTAPATRSHKLSGPARIRRVSVQMPPFHHSRLYVQCGGLKPQMQSQGTTPRIYNHHVPACTHEKSENLVATSPATVDHEVAKGATVAKSGSFKETKVSTHLDQGHEKQSRPVMECKKKSENINSRRKVDKKVVLAQGDAKGVRSPFVRPTLTPKDGKSIKSEKRQEHEKQSRHPVMECKKKSEVIESRRKQEKAVVVTSRKIQRVVPVVRSSPTLIYKDVKPIESKKHHQGHEKQSSPVVKKSKRKPVPKPPVLTARKPPLAESRKTTSMLPGAASISTQRSHTAVAPRWK